MPLSPYDHKFTFLSDNIGLQIDHLGLYDKSKLNNDVASQLISLGHTQNSSIREYGAFFFAPDKHCYALLLSPCSYENFTPLHQQYNDRAGLSVMLPFAKKQDGVWHFSFSWLDQLIKQSNDVQLTSIDGVKYFKYSFTICFLDQSLGGVAYEFYFCSLLMTSI